jgi:hypothetical protein
VGNLDKLRHLALERLMIQKGLIEEAELTTLQFQFLTVLNRLDMSEEVNQGDSVLLQFTSGETEKPLVEIFENIGEATSNCSAELADALLNKQAQSEIDFQNVKVKILAIGRVSK